MSKLEAAIIASLNRYLDHIRLYVSTGVDESRVKELAEDSGQSEDSVLRSEVSDAFVGLTSLTELAHMQDSGLSEMAYLKIIAIEKEANKLIRAYGWMYGHELR